MFNYSNALNHAMNTVQIGEVKAVMRIRGLILHSSVTVVFPNYFKSNLKRCLCPRRNEEVLRQITNLPLKYTNPS